MTSVAPASLNPSTVIHALNVPTFYQQTSQFWNMLAYLFSMHEQKPVWQHIPKGTHMKLAQQLHLAVEAFDSESHLLEKREAFYKTYYVVLSMTKGYQSQAQWLAHSPKDYLQDMYKMYRLLFSIRKHLPPLPNYGHTHPSLKI